MTNVAVLDPITPIPDGAAETLEDIKDMIRRERFRRLLDGDPLPLDEQPAEPDTSPLEGAGEHFITLLSVTVDSPVITEGKWKDGMTITVGRAEPLDKRGYFMTIKDGAKYWNSDVGKDDGYAVITALNEIGELISTMAQERLVHHLLKHLMHGMGEMPLSEFLASFTKKKTGQ